VVAHGPAVTEPRFNRAALCAAIYATVACLYTFALLVRTHFDVSRFVRAAPPNTDPALADPSLTIVPADWAFDGQCFYRLAIAPFSNATRVGGVGFDYPALRGSRIGMGLVGYVLSAGQTPLVPAALMLTNVLSFVLLGVFAGLLAQSFGHHALWGLVLIVWPGFAYSFALDTAEILAVTCLAGGLLALRSNRTSWAAIGLSGAVLTRESTVAVVAGLFIAAAFVIVRRDAANRRTAVRTLLASGIAGTAFIGIQVYGRVQFGDWPLHSSGEQNVGAPFSGIAGNIHRLWPLNTPHLLLEASTTLLITAVGVAATVVLLRSGATTAEKVGWIFAGLMLIAITGPWVGASSTMRASTEFALMAAVVIAGARLTRMQRLLGAALLAFTAIIWIATVLPLIAKVPPG
jgi:hypothetical protein